MPSAERLLYMLQASSELGLAWLEAPGGPLHFEPAACKLLGAAAGACVAPWPEALTWVRQPGREALELAVARCFGEQRPFDLTLAWAAPAGERLLRVRGRLLPAEGQAPASVTLVLGTADAEPTSSGASELERAISAAGIGLWELDLASGIERWSAQTMALYGLPQAAPAPDRELWRRRHLHPDDAERQAQRAQQFLQDRQPYQLDYRVRRADGSTRWLHSRAAFLPGPGERVLGLSMDITERKQAELRAAEGWQLLEMSARQVGFGFGYRDLNDAAQWSSQMKMMWGLAPDAPTPSLPQLLQWVVPEHRATLAHRIQHPVPPGELIETRYDIHRANDGQRRTLLTRAIWLADDAGKAWRACFAVIDLTEELARERQLEEALQRLALAAQLVGIGTWSRDADAERGHWDATSLALFGMPPDAMAPTLQEQLQRIHPEDHPHFLAERARIAERGTVFDLTFRVLTDGGAVRWLHLLGRSQRDAQTGRVQRWVGIAMDVTERREAEQAVRARELAERANQAKTEFLSRMSHELRTPLNAVLGFAQVMAQDAQAPLPAAQQPRLKHIQTAGWHLLSLIDDVLDIASIESREASLQPEWVPLEEVLGEVLALQEPEAARAGITLRGHSAGLRLWCDRRRLKQVLLNLVSNGLKYNRPGGQVEVGAAHTGSEDVLWVRDSGLGIEPARLAELFQPFNRLGRERSGIPGTGIGLTLCRQIAELMHGRLEVQSQPGVGSEFRFILPHPGGDAAPP